MNKEIEFIKDNINIDVNKLILSKNKYKNIKIDFCIEQINSRQKIKNKLPNWYDNFELIMPPSLNLEQSSSEKTAELKSSLFNGNLAVDLTGGFGIDSFYLAKSFNSVIHVEPNIILHEIAKYNFDKLKIRNVIFVNSTAEDYIQKFEGNIDLIYLDPSRRNDNKKTFKLEETIPNPINIIPKTINKSKQILIKISPLFDIKKLVNSFDYIEKICVVSVKNECKETLITLNINSKTSHAIYSAIDFSKEKWNILEYKINKNKNIVLQYGLPLKYIYEPNSSMQKLQCFDAIYEKYKLIKLHSNSHLFTSEELIEFQGRTFEVIGIEKLNEKAIKKYLPENKANITIRNFNLTTDEIKKKLKIKDGGEMYLFATTDLNNKYIILICKKINQE
ncbi:MAG: class I SAM-dependent methyltransferase [Candidatus Kapabacteria bacterium]|nr:class I SAM-dependent methyltransferase [Candidatus Kapabacteria bacterium]